MDKSLPADGSAHWLTLGGLATTVLSLAIFHAGQLFANTSAIDIDPFFLANYVMTIGYGLVAVIYNADAKGFKKILNLPPAQYRLLLALATISAFSLNRNLQIMGETPAWVGVYLYVTYLALILDVFATRLPHGINLMLNFLAGSAVLLTGYYALLSVPVLPFCFVGAIYFGLSLHMFAPIFAVAGFIGVFRRRKKRSLRISFLAGVVFPVLVVVAYALQVQRITANLENISQSYRASKSELPEAIFAGQYLTDGLFSTHILSSEDRNLRLDPFFPFQEINDPLAIVGKGFIKNLSMPRSERNRMLAIRTDLKHETQRRLWSGEHLYTRHVETDAEIFPEYRLAYVEKTIDVELVGNQGNQQSWQEEAVYTFHLPEGAVATSLSLWVDGVERKSRFTTKARADSAYRAIVSVERRDPALLHWQEGNTLVVTVFPVTPTLPRKFKLGVTIPLRLVDKKLVLENIYFEGPSARFATEKANLHFAGSAVPSQVSQTAPFTHGDRRDWTYEGSYRPYWELSCAVMPIAPAPFTFNQKTYRALPWTPKLEKRNFKRVYLDLNRAWEKDEFLQIWKRVAQYEVYTFDQKMIRLTPQNYQEVFAKSQHIQYSLFPFHHITDPDHALVISKTGENYVELGNLRESEFGKNLLQYIESAARPVAFFNIGNSLSPFLKSLREFNALNYTTGDIQLLNSWLKRQKYPVNLDDPGKVHLPGAALLIEQSDAEPEARVASGAPDHLMRLFAYNKTLQRAGTRFLTRAEYDDDIVQMAEEAYVVSPFTSLIVLETDKDYERFGIDESDNSLGNAFNSSKMAANNTGSVPEPHEWVLIILVLLLLTWTQRHRLSMLRFR